MAEVGAWLGPGVVIGHSTLEDEEEEEEEEEEEGGVEGIVSGIRILNSTHQPPSLSTQGWLLYAQVYVGRSIV